MFLLARERHVHQAYILSTIEYIVLMQCMDKLWPKTSSIIIICILNKPAPTGGVQMPHLHPTSNPSIYILKRSQLRDSYILPTIKVFLAPTVHGCCLPSHLELKGLNHPSCIKSQLCLCNFHFVLVLFYTLN